jgi:hypothetical protein
MQLTVEQVQSLYTKWEQNSQELGFVEFLKKAEPTFWYGQRRCRALVGYVVSSRNRWLHSFIRRKL